MAAGTVRYSAGNEHNPADPWGRSELVVHGDGRTELEQHHSRRPGTSAWAGRVDPAELAALWTALDGEGFPSPPPAAGAVPPDSVIRRLTVERDGAAESVLLAGDVPGYAGVVGLLESLIHRLSEGSVGRPG